ncbi:hypothetical protein [Meiothermus hypogaeus]|uniref:Uncharacterized protein n=2 Tax=Meiothermus hypogaeus TaxID=884155 RepID=A0A511QYB2_9DEIN|nr:hypothetical protein [Meiothermus hypogaeus]RIH80443.1 hypothetical protein Mhypo_00570 [Meiothermus hypogaeus]GEM82391.1 hypothetical protein MHY01S_05570 [Meiothermus hypogaeus NBRC 106114]
MSPLQERLMVLIGEAEAKGKGMKLAQLEQLVLEYGEVIQQTLLQGLVTQREVQEADQGVKKTVQTAREP